MRLIKGETPLIPDFYPEEQGWTSLKEPDVNTLQFIAIPGGLALILITILAVMTVMPLQELLHGLKLFAKTFIFLAVIIVMIPVHELLHALCHPQFGFSRETIIGVWPEKMLFYAHYMGELSRNRFLLVFAAPWLGLTALPVLIIAAWRIFMPELESPVLGQLAMIALTGSLLSSGDIIGFSLILKQVPANAIVKNQGYKTWWKQQ